MNQSDIDELVELIGALEEGKRFSPEMRQATLRFLRALLELGLKFEKRWDEAREVREGK